MTASKTQIDRLGDRLKRKTHSDADLSMLDEYRRSFRDAYDFVTSSLRANFQVPQTGRPAKSTSSIVEKLRRESIRLTQIQDIAGCRIVVEDVVKQDQLIESLRTQFANAAVIDRRLKPSHGYRAVHVVANVRGKAVEIQVRSQLQHLWAELSEKFSDAVNPMIKYGGGPVGLQSSLAKIAEQNAAFEAADPHARAIQDEIIWRLGQGEAYRLDVGRSSVDLPEMHHEAYPGIKDGLRKLIAIVEGWGQGLS